MLRCAEAFSRHGRDVRLVQQSVRDVGAAIDSLLTEKRRDIRIGVESTFRHGALHTRDCAQSANDVVAQPYICLLYTSRCV